MDSRIDFLNTKKLVSIAPALLKILGAVGAALAINLGSTALDVAKSLGFVGDRITGVIDGIQGILSAQGRLLRV